MKTLPCPILIQEELLNGIASDHLVNRVNPVLLHSCLYRLN